jgi:hypothetical protein
MWSMYLCACVYYTHTQSHICIHTHQEKQLFFNIFGIWNDKILLIHMNAYVMYVCMYVCLFVCMHNISLK